MLGVVSLLDTVAKAKDIDPDMGDAPVQNVLKVLSENATGSRCRTGRRSLFRC